MENGNSTQIVYNENLFFPLFTFHFPLSTLHFPLPLPLPLSTFQGMKKVETIRAFE